MATRSVALAPAGGWESFRRSTDVEELAWEILATWHYMNPTAKTSIWESETEATFYLAFDDSRAIVEAVAGYVDEEDDDLNGLCARLKRDFGIG